MGLFSTEIIYIKVVNTNTKICYDHINLWEWFVVRMELVGVQILLLGDCSVEGCVWFSEPMFSGLLSSGKNIWLDWHSGIQQHNI